MKRVLLFMTIFSSFNIWAQDIQDFNQLSKNEKIQLVWKSFLDKELDPLYFYSIQDSISRDLSLIQKIRIQEIDNSFSSNKNISKINITKTITKNEALILASEFQFINNQLGLISDENKKLIDKQKAIIEKVNHFTPKTKEEIDDLFNKTPDYANYNNGEYKDTLKLFLFCRHDRHYPCLFVLKDIFDNPVRLDDGSLWSLPGLAHSRRELPYNVTNGYTPSGVHRMDSVMPEANRQQAFGKYRRVILDWVPNSSEEAFSKEFLPLSAQDKSWWKEASIARDIGRKWLRIHGTGNRNTDPTSKFYPHFATSGCISTREMKYDEVDYNDQRIILDTLMSAMQLAPIYTNEVKIKGILYVIELDDQKKAVKLEDLKEFGIE